MDDRIRRVENPFEDEPDKYAKWNYNIGTIHDMAIRELFKNQQVLENRIEAHEKAHAAASREALRSVEMPPSSAQTEKPN